MPPITPLTTRTSTQMTMDQLRSNVQSTQHQMAKLQDQISTGKTLIRPSDSPSKLGGVLLLDRTIEQRQQQQQNLGRSLAVLNTADAALNEVTDNLRQAQTVASSQIGVGSDEATRAAQAEVVDGQLRGMLQAANRQYNDLSLFGGNNGAAAGGQVFVDFLGGVRYLGGSDPLTHDIGTPESERFTSDGVSAFGATSARVKSQVDLLVQANPDNRLTNIDGATGRGFIDGPVQLNVNGTPAFIDLTGVDTLDDIANRINIAITDAGGTGSVTVAGQGLSLTETGGGTITIADPPQGQTAASLGLTGSASSSTLAGSTLGPRLTATTQLADLGATVDWTSGLQITQGGTTAVADFSAATTIQDLQNTVEALDIGVRLVINDAGTGLDLVSEVSGLELSIGENGGATATSLGLRSLSATTALADFRNGLGVQIVEGEDDLMIQLHDGTQFAVNLDGSATVGDVVGRINTAAAAAGLTVGADFSVGMASTGNGLVIDDNTAGPADFLITNAATGLAAEHLGINANAGSAATIAGTDNAAVRVENIFTHMIDLKNALSTNDETGITIAGENLGRDTDAVTAARGVLGVQAQRVQNQQDRNEDRETAERTMRSDLQDADLTDVITRFEQLQLQLQAALQMGSSTSRLSLLDYLR
jgi:flagellin-like hook-associated protein FlgL